MTFKERYGSYALITGASSGIGEEFSRILARKGLNLVLAARRRERLEALAAELKSGHGVETVVLETDLSRDGGWEELVAKTKERDIGLLVNNAGFGYYGRLVDQKDERLEEMIRLNVLAFTMLTKAFASRFMARKRGGVILVSSLAAFQPTPGMALYGATKGFELLLGEAFSQELKGRGVDVTVLCPGATLTEFQLVAGGVPHSGMSAADVAMCAVKALGKRRVAIPGPANKITGKLHRFLPRSVVRWAAAKALAHYLPRE